MKGSLLIATTILIALSLSDENGLALWASPQRLTVINKQPLRQISEILGIGQITTNLYQDSASPFHVHCIGPSNVLVTYQHKMFLISKFLDFLKECSSRIETIASSPIELRLEKYKQIEDLFTVFICGPVLSTELQLAIQHQRLWKGQFSLYLDSTLTCHRGIYFYNKISKELSQYEDALDLMSMHKFFIDKASKGFINLADLTSTQINQIVAANIPVQFIYTKEKLGYLNVKSFVYPNHLTVITSDKATLTSIVGKDEYQDEISILMISRFYPIRLMVKYKFQGQLSLSNYQKFINDYASKKLKPYVSKKTKRLNDYDLTYEEIEHLRKGQTPFLLYFYNSCSRNCEEAIELIRKINPLVRPSKFRVGLFDLGLYFTHHFADLGDGLFIFWQSRLTKKLRFKPLSVKISVLDLKQEVASLTRRPLRRFFKEDLIAHDLGKYF